METISTSLSYLYVGLVIAVRDSLLLKYYSYVQTSTFSKLTSKQTDVGFTNSF